MIRGIERSIVRITSPRISLDAMVNVTYEREIRVIDKEVRLSQ